MKQLNLKKTVSAAIVVASALLAGSGCELTSAEKDALDLAFQSEQDSMNAPPAPPVAPRCYLLRHTQPEAEVTRSIDLLFITDTSGSLDTERAQIAEGIDAFVQALPVNVDYQVGVMLGHGSKSAQTGKLYRYGSIPHVLDSRTMTLAQIRSNLKQNLTKGPGDTYSDGGEEGMYAFLKAMEPAMLADSRAKGFFRPNAALAVIFIADENDICATYPQGVLPVYDPEHLEGPAFRRDCAGVSPEAVYNAAKNLQGDRPLLFGAIAYNNLQTYPHVGENEYGYGYLDVIRLASGVSIDMAGGHYNEGLEQIGTLATTKLNLTKEFTLNHSDVNPESIEVQVDGTVVTHVYQADINEVQITDAGGALSTVDVRYCRKPEPTPDPEPSCSGPACGGGVIGI